MKNPRNQNELTELIKAKAIDLGFDLFGVAMALADESGREALEEWLLEGNAADMEWISRNAKKRSDPGAILPGAKSVICLAINCFQPRPPQEKGGKIATYAVGRDYHKVLKSMLKKLDTYIKTLDPEAKNIYYSDTGPLLERRFAEKAGLGFIGKNSCLITEEFGSYILLAEIITTLPLAPTPAPNKPKSCGSCTRCMDACPNKAIKSPGVIDSRKCISYLTIEKKDSISSKIDLKGWIFGCDICQQACPHNCRAKPTQHKDFLNHIAGFSLQEIPKTDEEFLKKFAGSPLMRAKQKGLQRNLDHISETTNSLKTKDKFLE
jgi:epoxyqueuosine reductase